LDTLLSILEFVLALGTIILIHELGHFVIGRLCKIEVEEFGIGYPPRLLKLFTWKGTLFSLNWIPFGGFCRFKGEGDPEQVGGLSSANKWARLATLLGGAGMNFVLAIILFAIVISQVGIAQTNTVKIMEVNINSPAAQVGLVSGDIILEAAGQQITSIEDVINITYQNLDKPLTLLIKRGNEEIPIQVTPRTDPPEGQGPVGISLGNPITPIGFFSSLVPGTRYTYSIVKQMVTLPIMLVRGQVDSSEMRLLSPKGIYDIYSQVRSEDLESPNYDAKTALLNLVNFFAIISAALGFSNLLPIPAVDGGRILFLIPELLFNKRVPAKYENMVHAVGFTILLAIMAFVFIQDFINPVVLPK